MKMNLMLMKKLMFRRIFLSLLVLLGVAFSASAQDTFGYKATIESVDQAGFYKIYLNPALIAKSKRDLSDLRIMDAKKRFVPYIRLQNLPSQEENFIQFPILETSANTDSVTSVVVENKQSLLVSSLWLKLRNTAVSRKVDVLGSDDQIKWFAIDEEIPLQQATSTSNGTYLQSLTFPASGYKYFKINVNNKGKSPLKILEAGIYATKKAVPTFSQLTAPLITRKEGQDKTTYLNISFEDKFSVNKLIIPVTHPKYFRRTLKIFEVHGKEKLLVNESSLDSESKPEILFSSDAENLELQILNGDSPPLELDTLRFYQLNEYILAYLDPNEPYQLLAGDKNALQPDYDIKFFTDAALQNASEIKHGDVIKNPLLKIEIVKKSRDYTVFLWIAIGLVLALLSFLTWKMSTAVKNRS